MRSLFTPTAQRDYKVAPGRRRCHEHAQCPCDCAGVAARTSDKRQHSQNCVHRDESLELHSCDFLSCTENMMFYANGKQIYDYNEMTRYTTQNS